MFTRREFTFLPAALAAAPQWRPRVAAYIASLVKPDGAYGWGSEAESHLTPTYYATGTLRRLGIDIPRKSELTAWVRTHHPLPEKRFVDRPLRRFRMEQIEVLGLLGENGSAFQDEIAGWTKPVDFLKQYEFAGNPVFQQETAALRCRAMLKLPVTEEWRTYVLSRRRANGAFNNTPAGDGSGGHVMNTRWGLSALRTLGVAPGPKPELVEWLQRCQLPGGGFTYAPDAQIGAVDDVAYSWSAVTALDLLGAKPADAAGCARYLASLWNADGGFGDRPGWASSPMATWYAVGALHVLAAEPSQPRAVPAPRSMRSGLKIFTMQIEAPGQGSPWDAVEMARGMGIHIWAAKNSPDGWIARAQQVADARKVDVRFVTGNEEYGNYVTVPGIGQYSHLADLVVPPGVDFGAPMVDAKSPVPWPVFRDRRIAAVRKAGGRMIWQFNENEELTRMLLDEAVATGTYAAVSTFHFGIENFQHTQPFLMRYDGVLPFVSLQDAHTRESWWWGDQLEGFRTVFAAEAPTWEQWLDALKEKRTMAICRDARNNFITRYAGGDAALRNLVMEWWEGQRKRFARPAAMLAPLHAGDAFEEGAPSSGWALRVRLLRQNSPQGMPQAPLAELVSLAVDGREMAAPAVESKAANGRLSDVYHLVPLPVLAAGRHAAVARVRVLEGGAISEVRTDWTA